jgi:hypothetical protein
LCCGCAAVNDTAVATVAATSPSNVISVGVRILTPKDYTVGGAEPVTPHRRPDGGRSCLL